jgi:N-acetylglucosamine-6-phosphate deacetylase
VVTPGGILAGHEVRVDGGMVLEVVPSTAEPEFDLLTAGFVDLQVNGHDDVDVATATDDEWPRLLSLVAAQGVTSWCPTLVTAPRAALENRVATIAARVGQAGPEIVGVHLEGPFLGAAPGAHRGVEDGPIDVEWLRGLVPPVRIITLGPERDNAPEAVAALAEAGVLVALGHTTASAEEAIQAVDAGARLFTHTFNASGTMHHRAPGALGVALTDDRLAAGVIADGIHVDPMMLRLAWRVKPRGAVVLVTDATGWRAGRLADTGIALVDGAPRLADGTLAGSALRMNDAVRYCVNEVGVDLVEALEAASAVPAALLGLGDRGRLTPGRRADLVALDSDLRVVATWIGGEPADVSASG